LVQCTYADTNSTKPTLSIYFQSQPYLLRNSCY